MAMDLRPLTLGELLDRSFTLYRHHFVTFVGIMALPSVFALCLGVGMHLLQSGVGRPSAPGEQLDFERIWPFIVAVIGGMVLAGLAYWVAYTAALGATTAAVSELYLGRAVTAGDAYQRMRGRVGRLMLLVFLTSLRLLAVLVGAVLLVFLVSAMMGLVAPLLSGVAIVLGAIGAGLLVVFVALRYALCVPALVLEDVSAVQAIRRSIQLSKGSLWRILVLLVFATIIAYVTMLIFQGPFMVAGMMAAPDSTSRFWIDLAGAITGAIAGAISGPVMIIALALLYYDARIRQEGLDLQLLLKALETPPAGPPPGGHPSAALPG